MCYIILAVVFCSFKLEYDDKEQEARVSKVFGLQYRSTALLLTVLLTCIWCIREYHYYFKTQAAAGACLTALSAVSVAVQVHNARYILRDPLSWCSEVTRGYLFVADLTACTAAVVLTANYTPAPFTSSAIVHTVHGWCTPFAGFRLSADCFLHALNFQCFLIMTLCQALQGSKVSIAKLCAECFTLIIFNALLPMAVNVGYEARQPGNFSKQDGCEKAQPLWLRVLSAHQIIRLRMSAA